MDLDSWDEADPRVQTFEGRLSEAVFGQAGAILRDTGCQVHFDLPFDLLQKSFGVFEHRWAD